MDKVLSECFVKLNNRIILVSKDANLIYEVNTMDHSIKYVGHIPNEAADAKRLVSEIHLYKDKLIFIPLNASKIWISDTDFSRWESIEIENNSDCCHLRFFLSVIYKDKLYLFGAFYPAIIIIDLISYKSEYLKDVCQEQFSIAKEKNDCLFRKDFVVRNSTIYLASCVNNQILCFNMDSYQYNWISIGSEDNRFVGLADSGQYLWAAPRYNSCLVKININNLDVEEIELPHKPDYICNFGGIVYDEEKLILPGLLGNGYYYYIENNGGKWQEDKNRFLFYRRSNQDGLIYAMDFDGNIIKCNNGKREIIIKTIDKNIGKKMLSVGLVNETDEYSLEWLMRNI